MEKSSFPNSFLTCQLKVTDILKVSSSQRKEKGKSLVFLMLLKKGSHVTDF
jgi:hypothetical protein